MRSSLMAQLSDILAVNDKITGFCNLPMSVMSLKVDLTKADKLYRRQYPVPLKLWDMVDDVINRWFKAGRIQTAPSNCPYNSPLVIAFKKDQCVVDCICLFFATSDDTGLTLNEEMSGWDSLIRSLPLHLPGCKPCAEWFPIVAFPPFDTNFTEIYVRPEQHGAAQCPR